MILFLLNTLLIIIAVVAAFMIGYGVVMSAQIGKFRYLGYALCTAGLCMLVGFIQLAVYISQNGAYLEAMG